MAKMWLWMRAVPPSVWLVLGFVAVLSVGSLLLTLVSGPPHFRPDRLGAAGQWVGGLGSFFAGGIALWYAADGDRRAKATLDLANRREAEGARLRDLGNDLVDPSHRTLTPQNADERRNLIAKVHLTLQKWNDSDLVFGFLDAESFVNRFLVELGASSAATVNALLNYTNCLGEGIARSAECVRRAPMNPTADTDFLRSQIEHIEASHPFQTPRVAP